MTSIWKYQRKLRKVEREISILDKFRDSKFLRKFRRQLEGERSELKAKISKKTQDLEDKQKQRELRIERANKNRSVKMKRNWNYYRAIQENYFSDMTLKEIRSQHKNHRLGLETTISDVVWRNPSP